MAYRTHNCNELTFDNLNERVSLAGWVDTIRDHGGVAFIDLRDEYGVTQVVVNDGDLINHLRKESVISVDGTAVPALKIFLLRFPNPRKQERMFV